MIRTRHLFPVMVITFVMIGTTVGLLAFLQWRLEVARREAADRVHAVAQAGEARAMKGFCKQYDRWRFLNHQEPTSLDVRCEKYRRDE